MNQKAKEFFSDKRRVAIAVLALVAVAVLIIGLTATWFVDSKRLETVGKVQTPSVLKVMGPNASAMEEIDLAYDPTEFPNHTVTLTRTFSVVSGEHFKLQVAHTTNIADLDIKLYRVDNASQASAEVVGDADGEPFYWKRRGGQATQDAPNGNLYPNSGSFVNPAAGSDNKLGEDVGNQIFGAAAATNPGVQENAIPLYWELDVSNTDGTTEKFPDENGNPSHLTNFIIDISWTDSSKETDVLYLIAKSS